MDRKPTTADALTLLAQTRRATLERQAEALRAPHEKTVHDVRLAARRRERYARQRPAAAEAAGEASAALQGELDAVRRDRDEARQELEAMRRSVSWRLTAPIRLLHGWLREARGRLGRR